MTRSATYMARLKEAAQYYPVFTRPIPGEVDESYSLRRGCFACQHTGKQSLHSDHRFATVWFNAVNAGNTESAHLIQPLGAVVIDLFDTASIEGAKSSRSILPLLMEANTTFPKLWIYYMTTGAFEKLESPYVRLFTDRYGNVEHINARTSLWNNMLTKQERKNKPSDITLTIQGNWGKGLYLDPSNKPKGLTVSPTQLITASKSIQTQLLQGLQGEQQLTRIQPHNKPQASKKKDTFGAKSYADVLQDAMAQNTPTWTTFVTGTGNNIQFIDEDEEGDF